MFFSDKRQKKDSASNKDEEWQAAACNIARVFVPDDNFLFAIEDCVKRHKIIEPETPPKINKINKINKR